MVNTCSAGPGPEDQTMGSTICTNNPAGKGASRNVPAGDQQGTQDQTIDEDADMDDAYYHVDTPPPDGPEPDQPTVPAPLTQQLSQQERINAEIARLADEELLITSQRKLEKMRERKALGFPLPADEEIGTNDFKQRLALERAKSVRDPDVYLGQSQRALDTFFQQVDLVFETKPLTYRREDKKCVYAAGFLSSVPSQQWTEEKRRINRDPNQSFSYEQFKEFLKERQLPAHVRVGLLSTRIGNLRQRPNQSVPKLIAYLNEQEYQFDPPFEDRVRWMFLHNALHPYIRRSLVKQERGQESRADLEQAATALETVLIPPDGIKMKKLGYAAPELTTPARTAPSQTVAKRHPTVRLTVGYAGSKRCYGYA